MRLWLGLDWDEIVIWGQIGMRLRLGLDWMSGNCWKNVAGIAVDPGTLVQIRLWLHVNRYYFFFTWCSIILCRGVGQFWLLLQDYARDLILVPSLDRYSSIVWSTFVLETGGSKPKHVILGGRGDRKIQHPCRAKACMLQRQCIQTELPINFPHLASPTKVG
jgi:hypothetical protein